MRRVVLAVLLASVPSSLFAFETFREIYRIPVIAISATTFEVIENDGAGGSQLWCAAGTFARERLGVGPGERLYVQRGRAQSERAAGRKSVVFTTEAQANEFSSLDLGVRRAGKAVSITQARASCDGDSRVIVQILGS